MVGATGFAQSNPPSSPVENVPGPLDGPRFSGAGGIAMIAGRSRVFGLPLFMLTLAIAIARVPVILLPTR
jgi:hypothetical protein